ncbi:hypothetical protein CBL_05286 [Carabus blaptoides fortunei]
MQLSNSSITTAAISFNRSLVCVCVCPGRCSAAASVHKYQGGGSGTAGDVGGIHYGREAAMYHVYVRSSDGGPRNAPALQTSATRRLVPRAPLPAVLCSCMEAHAGTDQHTQRDCVAE